MQALIFREPRRLRTQTAIGPVESRANGCLGQKENLAPNSPVKDRETTVLEGLMEPRGLSKPVPESQTLTSQLARLVRLNP